MIYPEKKISVLILMLFSVFLSFGQKLPKHFPYAKGGLNEEQAAIHLLSRFTYGYNAGDVQQIQKEGLETWFARQLQAQESDKELKEKLKPYADAMLDNQTLSKKYPRNTRVRRMMVDEGYISKDSVNNGRFYREAYKKFLEEKGFHPEQELHRKFIAAKVLRAAFSANQLQEVMTDFWFNHFNVSFTKPQSAPFIPSYENHVIRPHALGRFEELLLETAKSPAMLMYLDNASSVGERPNAKNKTGINENYARELMELHTLGVDGGYTQKDVSEAARILTGWTVYPMNGYGNANLVKNIEKSKNNGRNPNVIDGDFVFAASRHDKGEKIVMNRHFENDGYQEGVNLITYLSERPQAARFICKKIAVRFVSDNPDEALVDKMAKTFLETKGDIKKVLTAMVYSPEFWRKDNMYGKVKTPFELAISSVRALDAEIDNPNRLINWVTRMGEKKYYYIAPTGFPDKSSYWINTGSLLNRMNFGLSFTSNKTSGVDVDLLELTGYHEPESPEQALDVYARLLLPTADMETLKDRLSPLLTAQNLKQKVEKSSGGNSNMSSDGMEKSTKQKLNNNKSNNAMLAQVVGLIIGSPEFQRR